VLRSRRLERLISRAKAANVQTEDRGFVMKTTTFYPKEQPEPAAVFRRSFEFLPLRKARAQEEKDPPHAGCAHQLCGWFRIFAARRGKAIGAAPPRTAL